MGFAEELPPDIAEFVLTQFTAEYASVSSAGVPIDTPTLFFASADVTSLDLMTGLAYPIKAERARRNPKVGLLVESVQSQPVVSIAGLATVRDTDFQANLDRYISETIVTPVLDPDVIGWDNVQKAIWYLTRIMVCITPTHIRWWRSPAEMDQPPHDWRAPRDLAVAPSDPPPPGKPSKPAEWEHPPWEELAERALASGDPGHLTVLDDEGYPLPIQAREVKRHVDGFEVHVPRGAPWSKGKATLSFRGREIFVGDVDFKDGRSLFPVERALPVLPMTKDAVQVILPTEETKAQLLPRLQHELARRGKSVPVVPAEPPAPTKGALRRLRAVPQRFDDVTSKLRQD